MLIMNSMAASKKTQKFFIWVCFLAYLFVLFYLLFFAEAFGRTEHPQEYRYNLTLFQEIGRYYQYGLHNSWDLFLINVVGNVVVFIPFGVFLPLLFVRCKNMLLTILLSFEFSLSIEIIQLVSRVGSFDVDDLLLNMIGGTVGFLLCVTVARIRKKRIAKNRE